MTHTEYKNMLAKDENNCYINLIIPAQGDKLELNLIGKRPEEFTLDEVVRMKRYIAEIYEKLED